METLITRRWDPIVHWENVVALIVSCLPLWAQMLMFRPMPKNTKHSETVVVKRLSGLVTEPSGRREATETPQELTAHADSRRRLCRLIR